MSAVKTYDAGSFNRFLTVETKNEVADGFGGFLKFYEARNSVWAHVKPVRGARNLRADKDTMEITHRILIQFAQADLQPDGTWCLSNLLRAQKGTEAEMRSTANSGARAVPLNSALAEIELNESEIDKPLNWRVGPASDGFEADTYSALQHTNNARSFQMLSPVHLQPDLRLMAPSTSPGSAEAGSVQTHGNRLKFRSTLMLKTTVYGY